MTQILVMAFRNLLRNKRRTALSLGSIIAGVAVFVLGRGFIGGISENIVRAQIDGVSGHVYARPVDYPTEGFSHPIDALLTIEADDAVWLDENTEAWSKRLLFSAQAIAGPDSIRVRGVAIDPSTDERVFARDTWRVSGAVPTSAKDGLLVSTGVAKLLGLETGGELVLQARTSAGAINALRLPIAGVVSTANPIYDRVGVFMTMDLAEELVRNGGKMSHVAVLLGSREAAPAFAPELVARFPGAETATWQDETRDLLALQEIRVKALNFLVLALMGMSATGIANTILMAAYERIREIGTLQAMGMTRAGVLALFVSEGAVMGFAGGLLGLSLGGFTVWWYSKNGIDLSEAVAAQGSDIPMSTMLYTSFEPTVLLVGLLFGVGVAVAASVWPARVASRMPPAEAVRAD